MAPAEAEAIGWIGSLQHATNKDTLRWPAICEKDIFDQNVTFMECDMNHIPSTLEGFDFCWSSCALEHIGSIEHGLAFIIRSIDCLKPGGWAVHTTEFNLTSNEETVDRMDTVLFRKRDFEDLARRLTELGHKAAPFDFDPGVGQVDNYIDVPPFLNEPCLKIVLSGFATTSFGIIVQRGES